MWSSATIKFIKQKLMFNNSSNRPIPVISNFIYSFVADFVFILE